MTVKIIQGDCRKVLRELAREGVRVQTCITSPPYWGLRDYGVEGQLGLEPTPEEYVSSLVDVFALVWAVLADDGTLWLNLGDCYNAYNGNAGPSSGFSAGSAADTQRPHLKSGHGLRTKGLKPKDLVGIPWRVALALQADGWYLRSDIIWSKPNPMPESVNDRPTKSHEYLFLMSKSERYHYDAEAIAERLTTDERENYPARAHIIGRGGLESLEQSGAPQQRSSGGFPPRKSGNKERNYSTGEPGDRPADHLGRGIPWEGSTRNRRTVWTVPTQPYSGAHFATFPPALIEPCILAGCATGLVVLDPFAGSGTTGKVAESLGRDSLLIELKGEYCKLAEDRTRQQGMAL